MSKGVRVVHDLRHNQAVVRALEGDLDESFQAAALGADGCRQLVLDLSEIHHVSSYGVREWVRAAGALRGQLDALYFVRAAPRVTDQFNMVMGFDGGGTLLSFYAYYVCNHCTAETACLFDAQLDRQIFASLEAPARQCHVCGRDAVLDDDPAVAFEYMRASNVANPLPEAMSALRQPGIWFGEIPGLRLTTRKTVNLNTTKLSLSGIVDDSFPVRRVVEGGGGASVLSLGQVSHFDLTGCERWRHMLEGLTAQGSVALDVCPPVVLRRFLDDPSLIGKATIERVALPVHCQKCRRVQWNPIRATDMSRWLDSPWRCPTCAEDLNLTDRRDSWRELVGALDPSKSRAVAAVPAPAPKPPTPRNAGGAPASSPERIAEEFADKYEVLCKLAEGGMAEVYLVRQHGAMGFRRLAVIKRVRADLLTDDRMIRLFLDEAKLAARIDHPNVIRVYDLGRSQGAYHMVLEFVHGRSLAQAMGEVVARGGAAPAAIAATIVADLCRGLAHAHQPDATGRALVHRDVTPANVLLGFDGVVKLVDFGLAGEHHVKGDERLVLGSPAWVPPEIYLGRPATPQSDLWGMGLLLLAMIDGKNPFRRATVEETGFSIIRDKVTRPWFSPMPRRLFNIIRRGLEKDPAKRYADARSMEEELRAAIPKLRGDTDVGAWMRRLFAHETRLENEFVRRSGAANLVDALLTRSPAEISRFFRFLATQGRQERVATA